MVVRVVLFNTSWVKSYFSFVAAAARFVKYPSREFMFSPAPSCCASRGSWASGGAAESAAPNLVLQRGNSLS